MKKFISASMVLALAVPWSAMAQHPPSPPTEIQSLRQEIEAMRATYEARLQALEQRLLAAERVPDTAVAKGTPTAATQVSANASPAASAEAAPAASSAGGANAFNPAMSLDSVGGLYPHLERPDVLQHHRLSVATGR